MRALLEQALPPPANDAAEALCRLFTRRVHDKGDMLLRQGDIWTSAFLVERGILRMHLIGRDGKDFNKNFHLEGSLICPITTEMAQEPSLFAISALEPTVLWQASAADLRAALDERGLWEPLRTAFLARLVSQKLQREHDLLTLDGTARYRQLCEKRPDIAERVPLVHLASFLGLTDVSLSRIRGRLRKSV